MVQKKTRTESRKVFVWLDQSYFQEGRAESAEKKRNTPQPVQQDGKNTLRDEEAGVWL